MNQEMSKRIFTIQETAMEDEICKELTQEHAVRNGEFLTTMEALSREQQAAVYDYLGVLVQMHQRMLELACEWSFI